MQSRPLPVICALLASTSPALRGQSPAKPVQARADSTISYAFKDGSDIVEITNVSHELVGDPRLVLRATTHSRQIIGDKGVESTVTMQAWPLGIDLASKPLYSVTVDGIRAQTVDGVLWLTDRGTDPDVSWWSVYQISTGRHLFDTCVDLLKFSLSREEWKPRYAGLDVPPDDTSDSRLKDPRVIAVLTYASAEKVIREALVTCDNRQRARILRSYADSSRTLSIVRQPGGQAAIRVVFSQNYPGPPDSIALSVPVRRDDLDITHVVLPPAVHLTLWQR